MVMVNRSGEIVLANAEAEQLFGYTTQELVGQAVEILVPERLRSQHRAHVAAFFDASPRKPSPRREKFVGKVREANDLIRQEAKKDKRIVFLDGAFDLLMNDKGGIREELYVRDRIHLNEQGYKLWAKMLRPHLKEKS